MRLCLMTDSNADMPAIKGTVYQGKNGAGCGKAGRMYARHLLQGTPLRR